METTVKKYFIEDKDEFLKLRASWKNYVNSGKGPNAAQILAYNVIRSMSPFRGFSKGTNPGRINASEYGEWNGYFKALAKLKRIFKYELKNAAKELLEPFGIEDSEECVKLIERAFNVIIEVDLPE